MKFVDNDDDDDYVLLNWPADPPRGFFGSATSREMADDCQAASD